jgi:hypothetical protein
LLSAPVFRKIGSDNSDNAVIGHINQGGESVAKKKHKTMQQVILTVPKGTDHFLRSGSGSHGQESRRTQRRKNKQSIRKGDYE